MEQEQTYDDEKDPPLAMRDQDNKRLPKTTDQSKKKVDAKEDYKPPTINESLCDLTQPLDNSSDEEE